MQVECIEGWIFFSWKGKIEVMSRNIPPSSGGKVDFSRGRKFSNFLAVGRGENFR